MARPDRSGWWSVTKAGQYRLTREGATGLARLGIQRRAGTFVSARQLVSVRDAWIETRKPIARGLAAQLKAGDISESQWILNMRRELKTTHIAQYVLGRGGLNRMTPADWGRIGAQLRQQYAFLNDFGAAIVANPQWSEGYIGARASMYFDQSGTSFERGVSASRGVPALPEYPGDGNQQCLSNCKCFWRITSVKDEWHCFWTLQVAEHCPDCLENRDKWNPLVLPKIEVRSRANVRRYLEALAA